jgi:hypothetical protein
LRCNWSWNREKYLQLKLTVIFYRYLGGWGNFGKSPELPSSNPSDPNFATNLFDATAGSG